METMTIRLNDLCNADIEVGSTLTLEGDDRVWRVISVKGKRVTVELVQVH